MNAATSTKSGALNTLEGIVLTAVLECLPIFVALYMLLKLTVGGLDHPAVSALLVSLACALLARWRGLFWYVPSLFDPSLSFAGKIAAGANARGLPIGS
jgi:hypothetical protein